MADFGFNTGMMGNTQTAGPADYAGDALGALGRSLMTSPSNDPLRGFGSAIQSVNNGDDQKRRALIQALKARGLTDQQVSQYLASPQGAALFSGDDTSTSNPGAVTPGAGPSTVGGPDLSFGLSPLSNLFGGL